MRGLASTCWTSASLLISRIWPIDGRLGVRTEERVLAGGAVDRGRLEQLPAVEDRLRVDARGAAAGRADLEQHVRRLRCSEALPMRPSIVPATMREPGRSFLIRTSLRLRPKTFVKYALKVEPPSILPVRSNSCWSPPARPALGRSGCANSRCLVAAGARRAAARRPCGRWAGSRRVRALARAHLGGGGGRGRLGVLGRQRELAARRPCASSCARAARGRSSRPWPGARTCRCCRRRPGTGRSGRGACSRPTRTILPSLTAITGRAAAGEDLDPAAVLGTLDHQCTVTLLARALRELLGVAPR